MNYRMIAYSVGRILVAVAATMLAPLGLSLFYGESIALAYVIPIVISVLIGLCVSAKAPKNKSLYGRDGMFIVAIGWIVISIIGCLPFYISGQIPSFVDSFLKRCQVLQQPVHLYLQMSRHLTRACFFGEVLLIGSAVWVYLRSQWRFFRQRIQEQLI